MAERFRLLRATPERWVDVDPILKAGEPGQELSPEGSRFKLGDGIHRWSQLDYFIPEGRILELIQEEIASAGGGSGDGGFALATHVNSPTPHPVYDEGPSLLLLYQNAKV